MSTVHHHEPIPKGALALAIGLALFALAVAAGVRILGIAPSASPEAVRAAEKTVALQSRDLRFIDRADGSVLIQDVTSGEAASVIEPGSQSGFIRGAMRGLARDRHKRDIGADKPFRLTLWADGQLSLTDLATGRSIEMTAFGTTNRAAFAALLPQAAK